MPEIAEVVVRQLYRVVADGRCALHSWVVMPNHVHVLLTPQTSLAGLIRHVKGPTACEANKRLARQGQPFWHEEYFDRIVRTREEFTPILHYIERNPVRAGLAAHPRGFRWSSASALAETLAQAAARPG